VVRELTLAEARELYTIRAVLEGLAARLFVENATPEQFQQLQQALELIAGAYREGGPEMVLETKNRFYEVLSEGAGSGTLSSMLGSLHGRIRRWRALGLSHPQRSPQRSRESVENLRGVLDALRRRDAEAAEDRMRAEVSKAGLEATRLLAGGMPREAKTS
jgi:DNA-binding GntR family transcriptional regulator